MQAYGNITHVLTVNTAAQVGPSAPSTVRPLQTLENATNSHKNAINTKMMAKTYKCLKNTTDKMLALLLTRLNMI